MAINENDFYQGIGNAKDRDENEMDETLRKLREGKKYKKMSYDRKYYIDTLPVFRRAPICDCGCEEYFIIEIILFPKGRISPLLECNDCTKQILLSKGG